MIYTHVHTYIIYHTWRSAIDSAQNDQTMVLQSLQATKQANVEKIRHLWGPYSRMKQVVLTLK